MRLYLSVLFMVISSSFFAQSVTVVPITVLPNALMETSGLEQTGPNTFWSHNDSGNQPAIYAFDSSGTLTRTIAISNATNVDWEDMTQSTSGELYIGDFGNNNNDRSAANGTSLKIYIISPPDQIIGNTTTAQAVVFEYEDRDFNAPSNNHNFDMEAFFFFNDSLHLFSKNRTNPTTGMVKHYILPAAPGNYIAMLVDSFNNGGGMVTSADIAPDNNTVALLGYDRIYLYSCYTGSKFLSTGHYSSLTIPFTQKEGILFYTNNKVYITDEYLTTGIGQKLYRANLSAFISSPLQIDSVVVDSVCPGMQNGQLSIVPYGGYLPLHYTWSNGDDTATADSLAPGNYNVHITDAYGCFADTAISIGEYDVTLPVISLYGPYLISNCPDIAYWAQDSFLLASVNDTIYAGQLFGNYTVTIVDEHGCLVTSAVYHHDHVGIDNDAVSDKIIISKTENGYLINNTSTQNYTMHVYALDGRLIATLSVNAGALQELTMPFEALHIFTIRNGKTNRSFIK